MSVALIEGKIQNLMFLESFIWRYPLRKFGFYRFQNFFFSVVIVISILLKTVFSQVSSHNQFLVKILQRSDQEKKSLLRRLKISVWPLKNCIETPYTPSSVIKLNICCAKAGQPIIRYILFGLDVTFLGCDNQ